MAPPCPAVLSRELTRLVERRLSDAELLRRFLDARDEAAFAALVRRHGGLVFGVARRVVGHPQDAEDVFQATFLVLARKAAAVRADASLASYLHGIALRLAQKARVAAARRRRRERLVAHATDAAVPAPLEVREWVDVELLRLPAMLREPVVLCVLEGRTQEEAARLLGCPPRTVKDRVHRGKEMLRQRLGRTDMTPPAMPVVAATLLDQTVRLATLLARGEGPAVPETVLALAGVRSLGWGRVHALLAVALLVGLAGVGAGMLAGPGTPEKPPAQAADFHGDPLPPGAVARLGTVRFRHPGHGLTGLGLMDSKTILSLGTDKQACLWELATGRLLRQYPAVDFHVGAFAMTRDGKRFAAAGFRIRQEASPAEGVVRVVDAATGKEVREWTRGDERMDRCGLAFTPDGKLLASFSNAGILRIEEVATGVELLRERLPGDITGEIAFSPDGKRLAVATGPNVRKTFVWEWQAGVPPREVAMPPRGAYSLTFTADSKFLVTGDDGPKGVRFWDAATGTLDRTLRHSYQREMQQIAVSPDGRYLASTCSTAPALVVWDLATNKQILRLKEGERGSNNPVFTPDSRHLVFQGGGAIEVFAIPSGKPVLQPEAHSGTPSFVALPAAGTAVTVGDDGSARVWDATTGHQRHRLAVAADWIRAAAVSPDGRWLATSQLGKDHAVRLYDVGTGNVVFRLPGHGRLGGSRAVGFTPDGRHLLSHGDDMYLRRYDVRTGKAVEEVVIAPDGRKPPGDDEEDDGMRGGAERGAFLPDGSRLVLVGADHLFLFDTRGGKQTKKIAHEEGVSVGLTASPDGKYLLMSSWGRYRTVTLPDGRGRSTAGRPAVCLVEVATGKPVWRREVAGTGEHIGQAAIRPDGKRYAVGGGGAAKRIEVGDLATGRVVKTIPVPAAADALAFSPDGRRLIAGLADTTAVVFDLDR